MPPLLEELVIEFLERLERTGAEPFRLVRFTHDPTALLPPLESGHLPPVDLPAAHYPVRVTLRGDTLVVEHDGIRCMDQHGDGACVALDGATHQKQMAGRGARPRTEKPGFGGSLSGRPGRW